MKTIWKWYEWGDERPGYVRTWHVGDRGAVIHGRTIKLAEAWRRGYTFECPWS